VNDEDMSKIITFSKNLENFYNYPLFITKKI
jgi:hypothetical protein